MVVKVTIALNLPDEGVDVNMLERETRKVTREAGKRLFMKAIEEIEKRGLERAGVIRQRVVGRWLCTSFGWVEVRRYLVMDRHRERYYYWLDQAVGIRGSATGVVRERGVELAVEHSYHRAADILSYEIGDAVSAMSLWRWVQREGKELREKEREQIEEVFAHGKPPRTDATPPALVVGEMDGTMIRQRGGGRMEVKVGVHYSEKKKVSRGRYRVMDKVICAGIEPIDDFAERWWVSGERAFNISNVRNLLLITDGLDCYREAVADYFPAVVHQLDRWHLNERLCSVVQDVKMERRLHEWLWEGRERDVIRWLKFHEFPDREDKAKELIRYLENNLEGINGVRRLPRDTCSHLRRVGSGVVEKTIGTVVCQRLKGRGRVWSPSGAKNLLALRVKHLNTMYPLPQLKNRKEKTGESLCA